MASTTEQAERYDAPENLSNLINWVAGVREEESDKNGSELVSDDEWRRVLAMVEHAKLVVSSNFQGSQNSRINMKPRDMSVYDFKEDDELTETLQQ
ncbi:uncharacterized protein LOC104896686 isoform X1 [Beta vulgaris subsp. vulgaris]|uniref:uncharacterized protein LOC104896686 isoform X1 n=1 Tax=Beta vulgaris subsp. vulgaris TaxID=3555 RepID=UPI002036DB32|nr:uncharacterized protein LOC104896686 isoform X1 [Beta vulgaris subsp. vulgaris]XP_048490756.1 uncharacterized protein LOC104896686 isoform X1 [Beta vulgaris subsp. vulgaris]